MYLIVELFAISALLIAGALFVQLAREGKK